MTLNTKRLRTVMDGGLHILGRQALLAHLFCTVRLDLGRVYRRTILRWSSEAAWPG